MPPLLVSQRMKLLPQKSAALAGCTIWMAAMFAALSAMWMVADGQSRPWMPPLFLICYASFFAATGVNNLAFGSLQGKLVHAVRRGRLMLVANCVGAVFAILAVAVLMPMWLTPTGGRFEYVFGFTALCFAACAGVVFFLEEPRDAFREPAHSVRRLFGSAWDALRTDRNFRRLAVRGCCLYQFVAALSTLPGAGSKVFR